MKKHLAALLCALFLLCPASAEEIPPFALPTPQPEAVQPAEEPLPAGGSMTLNLRGETLTLAFDGDADYSNVAGGTIQACFYAEQPDGDLYELYLVFPENVQSGDQVSAQSSLQQPGSENSVVLFISSSAEEVYAVAAQYGSAAYPEGSDYTIGFENVASSGGLVSLSGSVTATLIAMDERSSPLYPIEITAAFDFTMNVAASPALPESPILPEATAAPSLPGLVAPPDAQKI